MLQVLYNFINFWAIFLAENRDTKIKKRYFKTNTLEDNTLDTLEVVSHIPRIQVTEDILK